MSENTMQTVSNSSVPIKLGITNAALKKLETKYKQVPDAETKAGYKAIVEAKRELTPLRTGVEAERKIQVASAVEHQRRVNSVAKQIKSRIEAIEEPLYSAKKAVDDRIEREKLEAEQAEERRIADIESKVDDIQALTQDLLGADVATMEARLAEAEAITITDAEYMEFIEPASLVLGQVKEQLTNAVTMAKGLAAQQKEVDAQAAKMAEKQRLMDEQMAEKQRAMDEQMAAQQEVLDAQAKELADKEAAIKAEEDRKISEQQAADQAVTEEIRLNAEAQRKVDEAKEQAAVLKDRLSEDAKLRLYADILSKLPAPDVKDAHSIAVLMQASIALSDLVDYIFDSTQGDK